MTPERITELALANGFKLKEQPGGSMALNPYVFDFARTLLAERDAEIAREKSIGESPSMAEKFMVFDVESIGLHGEGFAVGYVVIERSGKVLEEGLLACRPDAATGSEESRDWVGANIPALPITNRGPRGVRAAFWQTWMRWREAGAVLVADCAWPVEARFLIACVDDSAIEREWGGPYPLHDLASVLLAHGADPLAVTERLPGELPAHNPLNDARQSARQLIAALARSVKS